MFVLTGTRHFTARQQSLSAYGHLPESSSAGVEVSFPNSHWLEQTRRHNSLDVGSLQSCNGPMLLMLL